MEKQYDEFIGVSDLHVALVTSDTDLAYTAGTPEYFAPAANVSNNAEISTKNTHYDNVPANTFVSEGPTVVTMVVSGVPAKKMAKYTGKYYDETTGRVIDTGIPNPPDVALSFKFDKGSDNFRYYQYLKGKFSGGTEEASTRTNSIEEKTYQMTFTAVVTTHRWMVDGKLQGVKRIYGDTDDVTFDGDTWFDTAQVPAVAGG
jgi:phi13 family phage major tail protein